MLTLVGLPARLAAAVVLLVQRVRVAWNLARLGDWPEGEAVSARIVVVRNLRQLELLVAARRHGRTWGPLTVQGPLPDLLPWRSTDLTAAEVLRAYGALDAERRRA